MLLGHLAGRIVVAPKSSQGNAFAGLVRPCIVIRPTFELVQILGLARYTNGPWSLVGMMGGLASNVHPGQSLFVVMIAITERFLSPQAQLNVPVQGPGARSPLENCPIITIYPDLVYAESWSCAWHGLTILCLRFRCGLIVMYTVVASFGGRGEEGSCRRRAAQSRCRCCGRPSRQRRLRQWQSPPTQHQCNELLYPTHSCRGERSR